MVRKPSRQNVIQFIYFNFGGAAFFIVGYLTFVGLYGGLGVRWWIAKLAADVTGWSVNYVIQRFLAFKDESAGHSEKSLLGKFTLISVINVPIDYAIVGGLRQVGVSPFIGLMVSAAFFTIWKYLWYKFWVFRHPVAAAK